MATPQEVSAVQKSSDAGDVSKAPLCGSLGKLCDTHQKSLGAATEAKAEIAQKYPYQGGDTAGKSSGQSSSVDAYNANIDKIRADEFAVWQKAYDANLGASLDSSDKQIFNTTSSLASALKNKLPVNAAAMSLSQVELSYPSEFGVAYAALQKEAPALRQIDQSLLLSLNPVAGNMTLNDLINRTSNLGAAPTVNSSNKTLIGILGLLALFFYVKHKK